MFISHIDSVSFVKAKALRRKVMSSYREKLSKRLAQDFLLSTVSLGTFNRTSSWERNSLSGVTVLYIASSSSHSVLVKASPRGYPIPRTLGLVQLRLSCSDMDLNGTCAAGTSLFNISGNSDWLATTVDTV